MNENTLLIFKCTRDIVNTVRSLDGMRRLIHFGQQEVSIKTKSVKEGSVTKPFIKFLFILSFFIIFIGSMANSHAQTKGELIVNFAYAPEKIRQGDTWKIYLSVTDPEGNMFQVVCRIEVPGESYYKPSIVYLKKGMEKQFTGYFVLPTRHTEELDDFVLALSILDRGGNVRKTLRFPLEFGESAEPMKPLPPDIEKDLNRRIGMIDVDWVLGGGA